MRLRRQFTTTMSALPAPQEQRQHRRRVLQTLAQVCLPGQPPFEVRTTDVSLGGLGIVAGANPPPKLLVKVRLPLPQQGSSRTVAVEFEARVVHSVLSRRHGGFAIGLAFVRPSQALLQAVAGYLG